MSNLIKGTCICIPSTSVRSCLVKCRNKADLFLFINKWVWKGVHQQVGVERGSSTSGCGKGCGHKRGSSGVAYDDSHCEN